MLINKKHVKAYALACADMRARKFTRVSAEFTDRADYYMREWIRREVSQLPSVGITIK